MIRDDIFTILTNPHEVEWQVQGFGMLRTYLPGEGEPRLQIWDQRLASWGNNAIHDHPWAFTSTIVAGTLFNQRYNILRPEARTTGLPGHYTDIKPGTRGGQLSEAAVHPCRIFAQPVEVYSMGDHYSQTHREMHITRYMQGTVTMISRFDREEADLARVAWYGEPEDQPPFVNPRPAIAEEIHSTISMCLDTWWPEF